MLGFMPQLKLLSLWRTIQFGAMLSPMRQEAIHQSLEAGVVVGLQQMHHLMHDDVFQALEWFPGQRQIQPDAASPGIA